MHRLKWVPFKKNPHAWARRPCHGNTPALSPSLCVLCVLCDSIRIKAKTWAGRPWYEGPGGLAAGVIASIKWNGGRSGFTLRPTLDLYSAAGLVVGASSFFILRLAVSSSFILVT